MFSQCSLVDTLHVSRFRWLVVAIISIPALLLVAIVPTFSYAEAVLEEDWVRQFGTSEDDGHFGGGDIVKHSSGVYIVGSTDGTFADQLSSGGTDAFVKKFDNDGNSLWTRQFGTPQDNLALSVAVDDTGVYIVGLTDVATGDADAFIQKFDHDGNQLWSDQFGTTSWDAANGVAADSSGVYVVGETEGELPGATQIGTSDNGFLRKYGSNGVVDYTVQIGTDTPPGAATRALGVDVFSGSVYVVGTTYPETAASLHPGEVDGFVKKFDIDGDILWTELVNFGGFDSARYVDAESQGIFVAGTGGVQPGAAIATGFAFLQGFDLDGNDLFLETLQEADESIVSGTSGVAVATGDDGGVYITGSTEFQDTSSSIPFIKKYDFAGSELFSMEVSERPAAIDTDSTGVYVAGLVDEALPEQTHFGGIDAFVIKYTVSPIFGEEFTLTVNSSDLSDTTALNGVWVTIRTPGGTLLDSGFTPFTFMGTSGEEYGVTVRNYDGNIFQHWQDDADGETISDNSRVLTLTSDTTLTAVFDTGDSIRGFTSLTHVGTEEQPSLTVNAVSIDGSDTLHMWTIIDPQSTDESGTTYIVYMHNYMDRVFDHWEDGSTDRIRTLTISEDTTITAYYNTD